MAYPEDLEGKCLDFERRVLSEAGSAGTGAVLDQHTVGVTSPIYRVASLASSELIQQMRRMNPSNALLSNSISFRREELPAWNFSFLKYVPGNVTSTPIESDTVSGRFSGCLYARYRRGGQYHAAHVGTTEVPVITAAAKAAWRDLAGSDGTTEAIGGYPHRLFPKEEQSAIKTAWIEEEGIYGGASLNIQLSTLGCFTTSGSAWAILVAEIQRRESSTGREMIVVLRVKPMKVARWDRLLERQKRVAVHL
jgi:hypothetical protein